MSILKNKALFGIDDAFSYEKTLSNVTENDVKFLAKKIISSPNVIEVIMNGIKK